MNIIMKIGIILTMFITLPIIAILLFAILGWLCKGRKNRK